MKKGLHIVPLVPIPLGKLSHELRRIFPYHFLNDAKNCGWSLISYQCLRD
jgi:hypothetical protein